MIERIEFIVPESRTGNISGRGLRGPLYHSLVLGSSMNVSQVTNCSSISYRPLGQPRVAL
jgi:hypothetical protein